MTSQAQELYERELAEAMRSPDPVTALQLLSRDERLPEEVRELLASVDPDGVQLSAMLVAKLRFERLVRGSPAADAWFEADAESFTLAFREYHREVPLKAFFPADEAVLFEQWYRQRQRR